MKLAIASLHEDAKSGLNAFAERGGAWVRFGNEVLLYASGKNWTAALDAARSANLDVRDLEAEAPARHLQLVVQKGRLFQQEQPEVPVLYDRGRYLVVALPPEEAGRLGGAHPCYHVRPLPRNEDVFTVQEAAKRGAPVSWVQALVDGFSWADFEADLNHLISYPTRHSTSSHYASAAAWVRDRLAALGYAARLEPITVGAAASQNVVAEKAGRTSGSRELVLVVAHLDSVNQSGGPSAPAPGADDNASGSAGLIAVARALKDHPAQHDLRLVLFGGEEQGFHGSRQYVAALPESDRFRLRAVINMDMIASKNTADPTALLEGAPVSQALIDVLADAAATYTALTVQTSLHPYASDHVPFIDAGLPAVLTIEGADGANTNIHTASDTLGTLELGLATEILKMNIAATAAQLQKHGGITMPDLSDFIKKPLGDLTLGDLIENNDFADLIKWFRPTFSGRYVYGGGAGVREAREWAAKGKSPQAINDPIYELDEPIFLDDLPGGGTIPGPDGPVPSGPLPGPLPGPIPGPLPGGPIIPEDPIIPDLPIDWPPLDWFNRLRFTLHLDIDGTDPLGVVSGTVAKGFTLFGVSLPHFIGRVTQNNAIPNGRDLVVEDVSFTWPGGGATINRIEVQVTAASFFATPEADVTFVDAGSGRRFGPYHVARESRYFRDVEVDVDREDGAASAEPYDTHTHPDRPADLPRRQLTLERAFGDAGIHITRFPGSGSVIATAEAQDDAKWNDQELHDSMTLHWDAFANRPQWKMWVFLAEHYVNAGTGGIMFDGDINEPGGVDRQGTAVFTRQQGFHTPSGGYTQDNPPAAEAAQRELFFNLIHETGHAFNLAHSFQKQSVFSPGDSAWLAPAWMPLQSDDRSLSWMNYPERATPAADFDAAHPNNATWFYERFRFRFSDDELLFLRHAPGEFVQMGNADWFQNHGRVARKSLDRRLRLSFQAPKRSLAYGEPVFVELQLQNRSDEPVGVNPELDPADGFVEVAVTKPNGQRVPFLPLTHVRCRLEEHRLEPGRSVRHALNLTVGKLGFAFKEAGPYRIEAAYTNHDGRKAAAVMQLYVEAPASYEERRAVAALFDARVGRLLYFGGSRVMEEANDKLEWALSRLGEEHPARYYLAAARYLPLAEPFKVVGPKADRVRVLEAEPDRVAERLAFVVEEAGRAADALSPLVFRDVAGTYARAAQEAGDKAMARRALQALREQSGADVQANGQRELVPASH